MPKPQPGGRIPTIKIALMGLLFALAMALSYVEGLLPVLPALPPGVKLGLSNIVTMYCLFCLGGKEALTLAVLKSLFVLLTRGGVAMAMSLAGGLCSLGIMAALCALKRFAPSAFLISVAGAVFHNLGQLGMASFILRSQFALAYLPIMVFSGICMGALTGTLLRVLTPYMNTLHVCQTKNT
ncbi:Gx transporter family protein [Merdimmobilis hominis]|uniref:Gx transporter family protein n=1 Tax=Merdimmobilis hominis TaxID=2897707 RepID=UPI0006C8158E|nr:Gx transporter family protein [Merdimmobilis hominis]